MSVGGRRQWQGRSRGGQTRQASGPGGWQGGDAVPLYAGAPTTADIVAWFAGEGFEKTGEETSCCQGKVPAREPL